MVHIQFHNLAKVLHVSWTCGNDDQILKNFEQDEEIFDICGQQSFM